VILKTDVHGLNGISSGSASLPELNGHKTWPSNTPIDTGDRF